MKYYSPTVNNHFNTMIATSAYIGCFRVIYALLITFLFVTRLKLQWFKKPSNFAYECAKSFLSMCWRSTKHQSQQCDHVHHPRSLKNFNDTLLPEHSPAMWHDIMDDPLIWWKVYPLNYFILLDAHSLLFRLTHTHRTISTTDHCLEIFNTFNRKRMSWIKMSAFSN
jgi:hypothetical protein